MYRKFDLDRFKAYYDNVVKVVPFLVHLSEDRDIVRDKLENDLGEVKTDLSFLKDKLKRKAKDYKIYFWDSFFAPEYQEFEKLMKRVNKDKSLMGKLRAAKRIDEWFNRPSHGPTWEKAGYLDKDPERGGFEKCSKKSNDDDSSQETEGFFPHVGDVPEDLGHLAGFWLRSLAKKDNN